MTCPGDSSSQIDEIFVAMRERLEKIALSHFGNLARLDVDVLGPAEECAFKALRVTKERASKGKLVGHPKVIQSFLVSTDHLVAMNMRKTLLSSLKRDGAEHLSDQKPPPGVTAVTWRRFCRRILIKWTRPKALVLFWYLARIDLRIAERVLGLSRQEVDDLLDEALAELRGILEGHNG